MTFLTAIVLGIVEGITEFLPISSTGHLILASSLLGLTQTEFQKTFEIVIQLGAILAVIVLYWRSFLNIEVLKRVVVAFIPTGIIGLTVYHVLKQYLLGDLTIVVWSLALGGLVLIAFEYWHQEGELATEELARMSYTQALFVGLFQAIAIIPGVSRSAATIVGGLVMGMRRTAIVEFSFLLAVPTMLAASGLDLLKTGGNMNGSEFGMLAIGFLTAFVVALVVIRWFLAYVRSHSFVPFGIYRIIVALAFFLVAFT